MSLFWHPHLTRGIVKTPKGAFVVTRGIVDAPDEIGESLGWRPIEDEDEAQAQGAVRAARPRESQASAARR